MSTPKMTFEERKIKEIREKFSVNPDTEYRISGWLRMKIDKTFMRVVRPEDIEYFLSTALSEYKEELLKTFEETMLNEEIRECDVNNIIKIIKES